MNVQETPLTGAAARPTQSNRIGAKAILSTIVVLAIGYGGYKALFQESPAADAYAIIRESLKQPDSFKSDSAETVWTGSGPKQDSKAYIVKVSYDAENSFGAVLRNCTYVAFFTEDGSYYYNRQADFWSCDETQDNVITALKAANDYK